jgi:glycosyltransferase involved in cell wall biosynthesis
MTQENTALIRVLLVGPLPPPYGGIPTYVRDLCEADIPDVKFEVFNTAFPPTVAPFDRIGSHDKEAILHNGILVTLKMVLYVLWSYPRLAYRVLTDRPDIVQAFPPSHWGYWRNWLYVLLAKAMGCSVIFHLLNAIDQFYGRVGRFRKWLLRLSFRTADAYILQSAGLRDWLRRYCLKPCFGFLNGLHLDRIPVTEKVPSTVSDMVQPVGLTLGTLGKRKGTLRILESISRLEHKDTRFSWIFVGPGDVSRYREHTESLHLQDRVLFTGLVSEEVKWQYLHSADFFCLPSNAEGQPISILEAMAAGLPVIATSVGSIPEVIVEGQTGCVIPVADEGALDDAIKAMATNGGHRRAMGRQALRYVTDHHNVERLFEDLAEVYRGLMNVREA